MSRLFVKNIEKLFPRNPSDILPYKARLPNGSPAAAGKLCRGYN